MSTGIRILIFSICFCLGSSLFAQDKNYIEHTIQSDAFDTERKIRVFLPRRYFEDTTAAFTVTYVLDAQYDQFWNMAKSNIDYMVDSRSVFPMIVVGIHSQNRGTDFRPPALPLKEHFAKEVFPLIEKNYRVNSFKTLIGHSWAGAFIGSTLFSGDKDLFNAYVSISPSMGFNDRMILHNADSMLQSGTQFGKFFYCSSGDVGSREAEFGGQVAVIDSLVKKYPNPTLTWSKSTFTGTDHWSCVIPSLNVGLVEMCKNYWAEQSFIEKIVQENDKPIQKQIKAFNIEKEKIFGYYYESDLGYIRFVGDDYKELEDYDTAIELYDWVLKMQPTDMKTHFSLAYVYDEMGNTKKSLKYYKKSLELLEAKKDEVSERYYNNVKEWLTEEIEKKGK